MMDVFSDYLCGKYPSGGGKMRVESIKKWVCQKQRTFHFVIQSEAKNLKGVG